MRQKALAGCLDLDPSTITKIIKGERTIAIADALQWNQLLRLTGAASEEFITAVHVSHATPELGQLVRHLQSEQREAKALIAEYERHAASIHRSAAVMAALSARKRPTSSS